MSVAKQINTSKAVTIRLDPAIRMHLETLANKDRRTISGAIRKAISDYLASNPNPVKRETSVVEPIGERMVVPDLETPVLSFRLPEDLQKALEGHAKASGETVSEIVRHAITLWIANTNLETLGIKGGNHGQN